MDNMPGSEFRKCNFDFVIVYTTRVSESLGNITVPTPIFVFSIATANAEATAIVSATNWKKDAIMIYEIVK